MLGLIVLAVFGFYILLSLFVIVFVAKAAINSGKSPWRWGIGTALFMYLIVFYDHIPTILLHKYYCATKAGFWVYKTPEQWKLENPGVAYTLTWQDNSPNFQNPDGSFGYKLNERFIYETRQKRTPILPVTISYDSIIDLTKNEVMVKRVRVGSGYGPFLVGGDDWRVIKFWVGSEACLPNQSELNQLRKHFKQFGSQRNV